MVYDNNLLDSSQKTEFMLNHGLQIISIFKFNAMFWYRSRSQVKHIGHQSWAQLKQDDLTTKVKRNKFQTFS